MGDATKFNTFLDNLDGLVQMLSKESAFRHAVDKKVKLICIRKNVGHQSDQSSRMCEHILNLSVYVSTQCDYIHEHSTVTNVFNVGKQDSDKIKWPSVIDSG